MVFHCDDKSMKFITQVAGIYTMNATTLYTMNATTLHVLTGNTPGASKHIQVVDQRDANWEKCTA